MIRTSDDTAAARERLMTVFDLSEIQTNYILEMPLRRLTKFSRIELEKEQETLRATIAELDRDPRVRQPAARDGVRRARRVAKTFGTPRRTVLLESAGHADARPRSPLEVTDDPCWVLLSSTGLLARTLDAEPLPDRGGARQARRARLAVRTTARGEVAAVTSAGRMIRLGVLDMPGAARDRRARPTCPAARRSRSSCRWSADEQVLALTSPGRRLGRAGAGHRAGRGQAGHSRPSAEQGRLGGHRPQARRRGRRRGRAAPSRRATTWCSSPPTRSCCGSPRRRCARRAGRPAGWPASGCRAGARVVFFGAVDPAVDDVGRHGRPARPPRCPAPSRVGQGDALRRVPGEGPRHRRRALPPVPARRGHR